MSTPHSVKSKPETDGPQSSPGDLPSMVAAVALVTSRGRTTHLPHVLWNKAGIEVVFICEMCLVAGMESIFAVFEKQKKARVSPGVTDERNTAVLTPERDQHVTEWTDRNAPCLGPVRSLTWS